jgi:hypothetical protein
VKLTFNMILGRFVHDESSLTREQISTAVKAAKRRSVPLSHYVSRRCLWYIVIDDFEKVTPVRREELLEWYTRVLRPHVASSSNSSAETSTERPSPYGKP